MEDENIIKKQLANSPQEIQKLFIDGKFSSLAQDIGVKNTFSPEQVASLTNEIIFVLLGMELRSDFAKNIKDALVIPDILARDIYSEINQKILNPVSTFLPTEVEGEASGAGSNLIEDAKGNSDNIITLSDERVAPSQAVPANNSNKPPLDILHKQTDQTTAEQKLSKLTSQSSVNRVVEKNYSNQDPYREPIN